jgi:hypothetical protein
MAALETEIQRLEAEKQRLGSHNADLTQRKQQLESHIAELRRVRGY